MEFLCVVLIILVFSLFAVEKPEINYDNEISKKELPETGGQEKIIENISYDKLDYQNIETRNIFSPDGLYKLPEAKGKLYDKKGELSDKKYRFIGVFEAGQKKAVFMKNTGDVIILNEGDKIEGGFFISGIKNMSVKLEKDDKVIEHRIFKLENELDSGD